MSPLPIPLLLSKPPQPSSVVKKRCSHCDVDYTNSTHKLINNTIEHPMTYTTGLSSMDNNIRDIFHSGQIASSRTSGPFALPNTSSRPPCYQGNHENYPPCGQSYSPKNGTPVEEHGSKPSARGKTMCSRTVPHKATISPDRNRKKERKGHKSTVTCPERNAFEVVSGTRPTSVERSSRGNESKENNVKTVDTNDATADEVLRLLGESSPTGVDTIITVFQEWLDSLDQYEKEKANKNLRLIVLRAFRKTWFSPPDLQERNKRFLSREDYAVFVKRRADGKSSETDKQRLLATDVGTCTIELLVKCYHLKWIPIRDILLAVETLGDRYTDDGYSYALYTLLANAGDKICNKYCEGNTCEMVDKLSEMMMWGQIRKKEDIEFYGRICRLVDCYGKVQRTKYALAAPSGGCRDNRPPRVDARRMLNLDHFDPFDNNFEALMI